AMDDVDFRIKVQSCGRRIEGHRVPVRYQVGNVHGAESRSQIVSNSTLVLRRVQAVVDLSGNGIVADGGVVEDAIGTGQSRGVRAVALLEDGILRRSQAIEHIVWL